MVELSLKLNYNPIIFWEAKLLSQCVRSCELLPGMAKETFVMGCLHLAYLCSGNVILAQCGQIQKIGLESRPNRGNLNIL